MPQPFAIQSIEEQLCSEARALLGLGEGEVGPGTTLQSLGMDSLQLVGLLVRIEKRFGISLMKSGITRQAFESVGTLAAAIHARQTS